MSATEFRAIVVTRTEDETGARTQSAAMTTLDDDALMAGDVTVAVEFSSINYKDGLALMGKPGVVRVWPLVAGIDLVGTVETSSDPRWAAGDRVILNGAGIGESHHGGLAERARVSGGSLVRLPDAVSAQRAAAVGTAGFTAMLAVLALERGGVSPDSGDVLVTGAAGGVGSIAILLLAARGYRVVASTGRGEELGDYLRGLGATEVLDRHTIDGAGKPLQTQRWAGAIDSVGSATLANILAQTNQGGVVASCGLAQGADLPTTVLPFILRAVTLAGINSVEAPLPLREEAWARLAAELDLDKLDSLTTVIPFADSFAAAESILAGRVHGRTVVDVRH
ncbi:oxidoreductase [Cryobacterium sp. 1639]|uniref:MDR family oxidoreductase n=1 Tax=Cryobacterium inferilacus TaxID=2866629 RepID=UPI001C735368|nr:MDR family oxidoreductase [Cryobacterium sp. 1639]MBX0301210.1 oxidoreductase [Cryobacterium sp. 1639]